MALDWFRYTADNATVYQLHIDEQIAAAAGFAPAIGTEPVLPDLISPRYAIASRKIVLVSTIALPLPTEAALLVALGSTVYIGGAAYVIESTQGEAGGPNPFAGTIGPQGPQGPQGPAGTFPYFTAAMTVDTAITPANTAIGLCSIPAPGAGTYAVLGMVQVQSGAAATRWTAEIGLNATPFFSESFYGATASQYFSCALSGICTLSAGQDLHLKLQATTTSTTARELSSPGVIRANRLFAIKIA